MTRPSSPELDPFDTPASTRPPSIRQGSPYENAAWTSSDSAAGPNAHPVLSRPSTGTSYTSGDASGVIMIPRTTPTTNQPRIRSMLNSRPTSSRSVANYFLAIPSSPLHAASHTTSQKPKGQLPRMPSHLIDPDEPVPKPWSEKKNSRATFAYWLTYFVIFLGFAGGLVQSYFNYAHAELDRQPLCLVFEENFDSEDAVFGSNGTFEREVSMDGSGNGEFEMFTASTNNSYVKDGFLYIVPTLTADAIGWDAVFNNSVFNITGCTYNETQTTLTDPNSFDEAAYLKACSAVSNSTAMTVINPVQSARISTRKTASIRYGRVEIRAKMPNGDWLWPALWMLPTKSVYGVWPRSGEIDIVEARGNGITYTARGSNYVQGSLNWGPNPELNGVSKTYSWWSDRRSSFGSDFHTYALEWTDRFMRIYVDSRLHTLLDISFDQTFFQRGNYPGVIVNGSNVEPLENPWSNGTKSTPFDQEFYLIMNVAVGGTSGWFPDWQGNKPWFNNGVAPMHDFANASTQWYPTWPQDPGQRGMVVDYVKMWKHCDGK